MGKNVFEILLVEDSVADATILREILKLGDIATNLNVVTDGTGAMAFLNREAPYAGAPTPHLILLDLNLPKVDGAEILTDLKQDDRHKEIPIIVFSSSRRAEEVRQCYRHHANSFITKPQDLASMKETVRSLLHYWFRIAVLPEPHGGGFKTQVEHEPSA